MNREDEEAVSFTNAGYAERNAGNIERARELYSEAAEIYRKVDNPVRLAHTVRHLADMDQETGNSESAETLYREALTIYRAHPEAQPLDLANMLNNFAKLLASHSAQDEARLFTLEARDIYAALEIEPGVLECTRRLAALA